MFDVYLSVSRKMYFSKCTFNIVKNLLIKKCFVSKRCISVSNINSQRENADEEEINCDFLEDDGYTEAFPEIGVKSSFKQIALAIQPNMKNIPERSKLTKADLKLSELCALVESIPGWKVADKCIHSLKQIDRQKFFGKGKLEELTSYVNQQSESITAVVVGINTLNSSQLSNLQDLWNLPVYDRYTLVLEIFRSRATTNEAKLQVSLAEIHYLRTKLYGMHSGSLDFQKDGLKFAGGLGETSIDNRKTLLRNREVRIQKELEKIVNQRSLARDYRKKHGIPIIAIVGYTNAGKTSLIKSFTGLSKLIPKDELFATLDITSFLGFLPNKTKVLYFDTIGFISDIHPSLFKAFSTTLQDISQADLLVHISDGAHPDLKAQDLIVKETLKNLPSMPESLLDNIIHVYNKVDLLDDKEIEELKNEGSSIISVKEGWGRQELMLQIQETLMKLTGRVTKRLRVPAGGPMLTWLYKETAVEEVIPDEKDAEFYLVKVTMPTHTHEKFKKIFVLKRT